MPRYPRYIVVFKVERRRALHFTNWKTYCTNAQVPDSACSAIAFLCGVKTVAETLGMDYNVEYKNCSTQNNPAFHVDSIMAWAQV